jgi:asparagine synthase (glutamine-hydrolysing)
LSAICGIYYRDNQLIAPETAAAMMDKLGIYPSDASGVWREGPVFLGCHARRITPESVGEILPYHDGLADLTITADAIIDNREELFAKLGVEYEKRRGMPDSQLILMAYQKWGGDCLRHLLGDFAFAIWDENRRELFCATDHRGTRTFYYYLADRLFAFATLIKPLFILNEIEKKANETWIADFLAIYGIKHQLDPELTPYQNVLLLPAGHTLSIRCETIEKCRYWQVEHRPELRLQSDAEYEEAFREVLGEAVRCRMRSIRPVGVMMSGGLDSTSVACLAARKLDQTVGRLQVFSAVPMVGYRDWLPSNKLADETSYIEAVREYAGNIDVAYCRSEGKHPLSDTGRLLTILEQPYKYVENLYWIDSIFAAAQERKIGVLLNGQGGNATISWGRMQPYALALIRTGQWRLLAHEARALAGQRGRSPLRTFLGLMKMALPDPIHKADYLWRHRSDNIRDLSPIHPDFARRMKVKERFSRYNYNPYGLDTLDSFEFRRLMLSPDVFSHMSLIKTKLSLAYGLVQRDPTADCRVIDFCLSVPETQYVRDGRERFLLRRAMAGILPDKVRLNETIRGKQSADKIQRLQPHWPQLAEEIRRIGDLPAEREYLDIVRIRRELDKIGPDSDRLTETYSLRMLVRSLIFSRFLKLEE